MQKIPKIVRARLARKMADTSAAHPDPNLLAAFAEDSLLARERESVTAHLAECADCRESLALAFAAQEPELSKVALQPAGSGFWLRRWRWVAPAAVACAVLAVALQYRVSTRGVATSKYQEIAALQKSRSPEAADSSTSRALPTTSPSMTSVPPATRHNRRSSKPVPRPAVETSALREPAAPGLSAARLQQNAAAPQPNAVTAQNNAVAPKENAAAALRQSAPAPQENAATVAATTVDATTSFVPSRAVATPSRNGLMDAEKLKAEARQPVVARRAMAKMSVTPGVLWSINASPETAGNAYGVVQRSADRGKTWESVALNEGVNFRAVAASGDDVWAGGSGGVLFHSPDGGVHWVEITVAGENSSLTGTIVSIDAHDPAQIRITTRSRERWMSTDRGRHWSRE